MSWKDELVPGYKAAVEQESLIRNAAFLPINESVAGYEVRPMTLRHYALLRMMRSPLLVADIPTPVQLSTFLWLLSPQYNALGKGRKKLLRRCREFDMPAKPLIRTNRALRRWNKKAIGRMKRFEDVLADARRYVFDTFQDKPPVSKETSDEPDYFSDIGWICAQLAREYGWPEEHTLDMPIKRVFQYLREIRQSKGATVFFSRSGRLVSDWLAGLNDQQKVRN